MTVKVKIYHPDEKESEPQSFIKLDIRRNLKGEYMIFDHADTNIVVSPAEHKIIAMPKNEIENTDIVYDAQNRLFKYLTKMGVIDPKTVEGGELYGTMEADYYESDQNPNATQVAIFMVGKFIEEERPYFIFRQAQEEIELERYADPDDEYTTELGEVPHAAQKGSIYPNDFPSGANYRVFESKIKKDIGKLFELIKGKK